MALALPLVVLSAALFAADPKTLAPEPFNLPLWDAGKVPLASGDGPLDAPFLTAFLPPPNKRNGSAVIIAPGGSNIMLMYGAEGIEVAERFNDWGACAFVLTYRLSPKYNDDARIADGNRAVQLIRARAKEWGVDPAKIGLAGFSAGSALVRHAIANAQPGNPSSPDPIERVSSKPDYGVMIYSAGRKLPNENLKDFPPMFLLAAQWDRGAAAGTVSLYQEMTKAGTVAELHIYQKGRHGFGAAFGSPEFHPWMDLLRHFLIQDKFLPEVRR